MPRLWADGALPQAQTRKLLADYFGVTSAYLMGDVPLQMAPIPSDAIPLPVQKKIPVYTDVSAGRGVLARNEITGYECADERYADGNHFYLRVHGDSMSPRLQDGDLVLVRRAETVDSGDIGVFLIDGEEGLIKRAECGAGHVALISLNPTYPPRVFVGADVQRVRVLGKVIQLLAKFGE